MRGRPLLPEMLGQTDRVGAKSPIFDLFSLNFVQDNVTRLQEAEVARTLSIGTEIGDLE